MNLTSNRSNTTCLRSDSVDSSARSTRQYQSLSKPIRIYTAMPCVRRLELDGRPSSWDGLGGALPLKKSCPENFKVFCWLICLILMISPIWLIICWFKIWAQKIPLCPSSRGLWHSERSQSPKVWWQPWFSQDTNVWFVSHGATVKHRLRPSSFLEYLLLGISNESMDFRMKSRHGRLVGRMVWIC